MSLALIERQLSKRCWETRLWRHTRSPKPQETPERHVLILTKIHRATTSEYQCFCNARKTSAVTVSVLLNVYFVAARRFCDDAVHRKISPSVVDKEAVHGFPSSVRYSSNLHQRRELSLRSSITHTMSCFTHNVSKQHIITVSSCADDII